MLWPTWQSSKFTYGVLKIKETGLGVGIRKVSRNKCFLAPGYTIKSNLLDFVRVLITPINDWETNSIVGQNQFQCWMHFLKHFTQCFTVRVYWAVLGSSYRPWWKFFPWLRAKCGKFMDFRSELHNSNFIVGIAVGEILLQSNPFLWSQLSTKTLNGSFKEVDALIIRHASCHMVAFTDWALYCSTYHSIGKSVGPKFLSEVLRIVPAGTFDWTAGLSKSELLQAGYRNLPTGLHIAHVKLQRILLACYLMELVMSTVLKRFLDQMHGLPLDKLYFLPR